VQTPAFFIMPFKNNTEANRYELEIDGHISFADYKQDGDKLVITHVVVPEALRGKGIAAMVMEQVVADAKTKKLSIMPLCSYAAAYLKKHPQ